MNYLQSYDLLLCLSDTKEHVVQCDLLNFPIPLSYYICSLVFFLKHNFQIYSGDKNIRA